MQSDMTIPRTSDIVSRALDYRESAVRLGDSAAVGQLDRLIAKLPEARLCWALGVLHIDSPSGNHYQVTRGGCDCLNAQRCGRRQCWHLVAYELLIDMFTADCDSADDESLLDQAAVLIDQLDAIQGDSDFEADCDEPAPREWRVGAFMRSLIWATL